MQKMYSTHEILSITGLSRATIDRYEKQGIIPRAIRLTSRCSRWRASEIDQWIADGCPKKQQPLQANDHISN